MSALLTAASVLLTVWAFPPEPFWPAACVMLAPLVVALERSSARRAFFLGSSYTLAMALVIVRWFVHALSVEYGVASPAAWAFTVLLVGAYSLLAGGAAAFYSLLRPRLGLRLAPLVFAAAWTLAEWLRAEPGGLPWLLAGHTLAGFPVALQIADLGGVTAVGFTVSALCAGVALSAVHRSPQPLLIPVACMVLSIGYGTWRLSETVSSGRPLHVAVIQVSVPQSERFRGTAESNVRRHVDLTRAAAARGSLDLVVWSETAVDADLDRAPELRAMLSDLSRELHASLVTGAPRSTGGRHTNSVVLFGPVGRLRGSYDKQRLVPFSEYDPPWFRWLAPLLGPVTDGVPYVAGTEPTLLLAGSVALATPVCFEITYPHLIRRFRSAGAQVLVNVSNDAWFGSGGYSEMHLLHARFRAIEERSWVLRGANTGISAVIDPNGRVVDSLPAFTEGTLRATVHAAGALPFYAREGDVPVLAFLVMLLVSAWIRTRLLRKRAMGRGSSGASQRPRGAATPSRNRSPTAT